MCVCVCVCARKRKRMRVPVWVFLGFTRNQQAGNKHIYNTYLKTN